MILIDTKVVSEMMRVSPDPDVRRWLDAQAAATLFLSAISLGELLFGIAVLPAGKRRSDIEERLNTQVDLLFGGRILSFDEGCARSHGRIVSEARSRGRVISIPDGQIAAIARVHRMKVATRDVTPFEAANVDIVNPWTHLARH